MRWFRDGGFWVTGDRRTRRQELAKQETSVTGLREVKGGLMFVSLFVFCLVGARQPGAA